MVEIWGIQPTTKSAKSRIGKLSRDFRARCEAAGFAADEIEIRFDRLTARFGDPNMATPEALEKHWDTLGDESSQGDGSSAFIQRDMTPEEIERDNEFWKQHPNFSGRLPSTKVPQ